MSHAPKVKIGMLQHADTVEFKVTGDFDLVDKVGNVFRHGLANKRYLVKPVNAKPARLQYLVRLAIRETLADAEIIQEELREKGFTVKIRQYGLVLNLPEFNMDNREYWLVTGPFLSREEAETYQSAYEFPGEAVVISDVLEPASGQMELDGQLLNDNSVQIVAKGTDSRITLFNVLVGIEFHWQHYQAQEYKGTLEITYNNSGKLAAINIVDIDDYLSSVNASEMTEDCPIELLRSHTIAARSTILATMGKHHHAEPFHLCADDHCQRYYGAGVERGPSREATFTTAGEVLIHHNRVCDARYSKICGGIIESYHNVWDNRPIPYLTAGVDGEKLIDWPIDTEAKAQAFIDSYPDVYCNTKIYEIPKELSVSSKDLFRWQVSYSNQELGDLITKKTGLDFGHLIDIIPIKRGDSGRIILLEVIGSKRNLTIGKELAIRRALSTSHLYSSCFYIKREYDHRGNVVHFTLVGAGWGHGVGLCQVGATVMAQKKFSYQDILKHYYRNAEIVKIY